MAVFSKFVGPKIFFRFRPFGSGEIRMFRGSFLFFTFEFLGWEVFQKCVTSFFLYFSGKVSKSRLILNRDLCAGGIRLGNILRSGRLGIINENKVSAIEAKSVWWLSQKSIWSNQNILFFYEKKIPYIKSIPKMYNTWG